MGKTWRPANEDDEHFGFFQVGRWHDHRCTFPSRPHTKQLVFTSNPRPNKNHQLPWHVYVQKDENEGVVQQWVLVPTLVPVVERTQPLAGASGASPETRVFHCENNRCLHEHWTNIQRVEFIARRHPLISSVEKHKADKALHPTDFNKRGRTCSGHQSPYDLQIVLAASGARMGVGITGNGVAKIHTPEQPGGLLALWWRPFGVASFQRHIALLAEVG